MRMQLFQPHVIIFYHALQEMIVISDMCHACALIMQRTRNQSYAYAKSVDGLFKLVTQCKTELQMVIVPEHRVCDTTQAHNVLQKCKLVRGRAQHSVGNELLLRAGASCGLL